MAPGEFAAIGAGIIGAGAVWPIGVMAALAEVAAIALDRHRAAHAAG